MKILVISRTAWKQNNSFGNTYNNIFGKMNNIEIANIYLADGIPDKDNPNVVKYYQVSEKQMIKSFMKKKAQENKVGEIINPIKNSDEKENVAYKKTMNSFKKNRWSAFFIAREFIWKFGNINMDGILKFAQEFKPDVIFLPFYYAMYVDRVALFLKKHLDIPIVLEASLDIYSLKQISFDPFFWINRFMIRNYVRKTVKKSEKLYVISDKMKKDYEKYLHIDCGILYKFPDSERNLGKYSQKSDKLQFLFTGNIGSGRWKTLALIGNILKKSDMGELTIYTPTPITKKMKDMLKNCTLKPPVLPEQVVLLQNKADVLVHAESFGVKEKLEVRYSISTKVMDYISAERCILAVGPSDIASISFLKANDLALVASDEKTLESVILSLGKNHDFVSKYANNTHKYMKKMLAGESQQEILYKDLKEIILNYKK